METVRSDQIKRLGLVVCGVALSALAACVEPGEQSDDPLAFPNVTVAESDAPPANTEAPPADDAMANALSEAGSPEDAPLSSIGGFSESEPASPAGVVPRKPSADEFQVWGAAAQQDHPIFYENYLSAYPNGVFAERARKRIEALSSQAANDQAARDEVRDRLRELEGNGN